MIFGWVQLSHPGGASAEWGSSCQKFPCGYGSTSVVTPPLSGDLQVEILIQILLIYYICDPHKYKAIVSFDWSK